MSYYSNINMFSDKKTPLTSMVQHLEAVTISVDYADFLDESLKNNLHHFDEYVVVTSHKDKATQRVCAKHSVICVETDVFTMRGEPFNKGLGINLGLAHLRHLDWMMHIDADIILPDRFRTMLNKSALQDDCIYGADRLNVIGADKWREIKETPAFERQFHHRYLVQGDQSCPMGARILHNEFGWCPIGYFQLWHASAHRRYPVNQGGAEHTDLLFSLQWPINKRLLLPNAIVYHLESEKSKQGTNWGGRKTKPFKL